ncbi:MAG: hypothetical protein J6V89_03950 [Acetobacter sp.]|nr:hypothetical protein [Acetobacter sp.]
MKKFLWLFIVVFGLFSSFSHKSLAQATYATNNYGGILSQQNGDNSNTNTIDQTMTANVCNSSSPHAVPKSSFDR